MIDNTPATLTVFTKPWTMPLPQLGARVQALGFDGIELPVRPGFQIEPRTISKQLPDAVRVMADFGLKIASIAGPIDEEAISACAKARIPLIRICLNIPDEQNYFEYEAHLKREFDLIIPTLERYGVTIGIQNEFGRCISTAMGIRHLIEEYSSNHLGAVLDPAHCALNGEVPGLALDIVWSHLRMVNLKNAYWRRTNGPEATSASYEPYWTSGRQGLCSWSTVVSELQKRHYNGPICLTAEYTDEAQVDRLIREDIQYLRELMA